MKILYIGSSGALSTRPLQYLLQSEHTLCAVAIASQQGAHSDPCLPVFNELDQSVETLARHSALPIIDLSAPLDQCLAEMRRLAPELILVSCYHKKLPRDLIELPLHGCFNFHPSLLPAYRGPVPGFWQFRDGCESFGVSLHRISDRLDAGALVAQSTLLMPDGVSMERANQLFAQAYVDDLLPGFLAALGAERLVESAQNEAVMSYQSYPGADDFRVDSRWSARRLFNFVCATQHWGRVYPCRLANQEYELQSVLGYNDETFPEENCVINGNTIQIACDPGTVLAQLATH